MPGHVAVVIVGFRNPGDIAGCLAALADQTHADFSVVVCENGGREACRDLADALPDRLAGGQQVGLVCAVENLGYAGGVNLGIVASPLAEAWWVLNPDTQPEPQALELMLRRLRRGDCDAVGSTMVGDDGRVLGTGYTFNFWTGFSSALGYGRSLDEPIDAAAVERRTSFISGASMLVSRRFVETVGLMREDYFLYCEETEWCQRARLKGLRLGLALDARVHHLQGTTTGARGGVAERPRLPVFLGERNSLLMVRDLYPMRWPLVALPQLATTLVRFARRRAWRQIGYAFEGWRDGVLDRRGKPVWFAG
ncbi:MAG TPA: glycosyltransferase family 2 protein [Caulobacteraceae bacterium]|jgi:hypothetical protein|nr:glycosyltransferase family 2 protein [Caulobacteraceae bacterium]